MTGPRSIAGEPARLLRALLRAHARSILPVGVVVVVGVVLVGILAGLYALLIGVTAYQAVIDSVSSIESLTVAVTLLFLPLVLLALLASLVWAGIAVQAANVAIDARRASMPSAAWRAFRRSPRAFAVIVVILAAATGAILIAPLLVIVGIVGLIVKAPAEGSRFAARWPSRGALIAMAVPFGVAALVLVRWSLALPAVWLDGLGVRAALAESSRRVRGRGPAVAIVLVLTALVTFGLTEGIAALVVPFQGGSTLDLVARIVALILVGPLPFVALAVLYRRGTTERPAPLPAPASRRSRVAVAAVVSMVIPLLIGTTPGSAIAAGVSSVTLVADHTETVVGQDLLLQATVTAPTAPGGTVTFEAVPSVGATIDLGTRFVDGSGVVLLQTAALPADDYQLQARFSGDAQNDPATSPPVAHTVHQATASVTVNSIPLATGDQATLTASYAVVAPGAGTPSGTVTVSGGGHDFGPATLDASGVATLTVDLATAGTRELTVAYSGDAAFAASTTTHTVPKIATTTEVDGSRSRVHNYGDSQTYSGVVHSASDTTPTGTVQLWAEGRLVAEDTLGVGGVFSITSDQMRAGIAQPVFVAYVGDASHAPSDNSPIATRIMVLVNQALSIPVVSISDASPTIGETVTVTATLDDLGVGATGWMTFYKDGLSQGQYPVTDGHASYPLQLTSLVTWLTASYAGNINFTAQASEPLRVDAARAPVTISIDDPGPLVYGQVFSLTATVSVAGGALVPNHGVLFRTPGGLLSSTEAAVVGGRASLQVCAAEASACHGVPALGSADVEIVAQYLESSVNLAADSAPFAYTLADKAETTTTLEVVPGPIPYGSAVFLKATVTSSTSATPTGTVSFYGAEPVPGDPDADPALAYLGSAPVGIDGIARLETQSGIGIDDLRWPANGITAIYSAGGALFKSSRTTVPITIQRIGVTLDVFATSALIDQATPLEVRLSHDPGASEDFTGQVTITSDTGDTCSVWVPAGERNVSCSITWDTVGAHSYSATYSGDLVFAPGASTSAAVTVTRPASNLGASVPFNVVAGEDVTVTWQLFDPAATGTVTVWGDGVEWCSKPIGELSCVGRFGAASATGSTVPVIVRYSGDANFAGAQDDLVTRVQGCVELDVRSSSNTLGTVTVDTPSNCGVGRYLVGTTVTVSAHPLPNGEFVDWKKPGGLSLVVASTTPTTSFLLTYDSSSWVHVATFQVVCATVSAAVTGHGKVSIYPAGNCTTVGGEPGYSRGTTLWIYPDGLLNPVYGDADVFYSWGPLPAGVSARHDSSGRDHLTLTVQADVVVPVAFGPRCRAVTVTAVPSATGDRFGPVTAPNCLSPQAIGFLPGTLVKVAAEPALASRVLSAWAVDGVVDTALGREAQPTVVVQYDDLAVTAQFVDCYNVNVVLDGANNDGGQPIGYVRTDPAPNCPDTSGRFLAGTAVTLTPEVLVEGAAFNGWGLERGQIITPADGIGDVTSAIRQFVVSEDVELQAGFYLESSCSRLSLLGNPSLVSFDNTGCGAGYYFDLQKQWANRLDVKQSTLWQDKYRSSIFAEVDPSQPLDVYASVRGDTRTCFGKLPTTSGPTEKSALDWQLYGPLARPSTECRIGGQATVWVQACQTIVTNPSFHVAGSGGSYDRWSMPGTFYLMNSDGAIEGFSMAGFDWAQPIPVSVRADGSITRDDIAPGPCRDSGHAFPAKTDLVFVGAGPSTGFSFDGWSEPSGLEAQNPVLRKTTETSRTMTMAPSYTVTCHTITFGEGISIVGDAPRCPGSSEADNSFIAGTAIQVKAVQHIGDRIVEGFRGGIVAGQIYEDPESKELTAFAFVDGDKNVAAYYPSDSERTKNGVIQGLKFTTGIFAVAAPIFVGMLFPPAGILFAVLGAGAGIASFIPGGDKVAAVFDLVNPTKISTCIARWSFNNAGDPTGGANVGGLISTANTIRKVLNGVEVLVEPIGPIGAAGGLAGLGYGLYDAGIGDSNWGPQTVEQLADESTLTNCLDDQWRAAD